MVPSVVSVISSSSKFSRCAGPVFGLSSEYVEVSVRNYSWPCAWHLFFPHLVTDTPLGYPPVYIFSQPVIY